jgi:hypothetical protein
VSVPEREPPVFAATAIRIAPDAEPLRTPGSESHAASTVAFHEQPLSVVSCTSSVPPAAAMLSPDRLSEKVHGAAACVTAKRCVATTSSALREAGAGLLATLYERTASPLPDEPSTATHDAWAPTVHVQSRAALMRTVPLPPVEANCDGVASAVTWHLLVDGAVADVDVDVQPRANAALSASNEAAPVRVKQTRSTARRMHAARQQPGLPRCPR